MNGAWVSDEVDVKGLTTEAAARKERMRKVMDYRAELSARPQCNMPRL